MPRDSLPWEGPSGYRTVCAAGERALRPIPKLSLRQWSDTHRWLSTAEGPEGGKRWTTSRVPFLAAIMDALDESHPAQIVVFKKSAQVGGTNVGLNWIGRTIHHDPVPFAALFPTDRLASRWVRGKLDTMIEATPVLRQIIPQGRKVDGNTVSEKHFPGGVFYAWSANIPSDVSSSSITRGLADEVDRFPPDLENEGDPIELFLRRQAAYVTRRKAFLNSTPTIRSLSHIDPWYERSSQGQYHVPCPHCGEKQVLRIENLRYPEANPRRAVFVCEENGCVIEEVHKTAMLEGGEWQHRYPEREIVGFHINAFYVPIGLGDSWGDIAVAFERAKRSPEKLKTFTNTFLGETNDDPTEKLDWQVIQARAERFDLREIPPGCLILTAATDVQKDRLEVLVAGWGRNEALWTIDHHVIEGDPTRPEVWEAHDAYLDRRFRNSFGVDMKIEATAVDSSYIQHDVTNYTRTRDARNVFAVKGMPQVGKPIIVGATYVDVKFGGKIDKRGAKQYPVGTVAAKHRIASRLISDGGLRDKPAPLPSDRHFHFSDQLPEEFFRQLTAEVWDPKARKWVKTYERNEILDLLVYAHASAFYRRIRVDAMRPEDWDALERQLQPAQTATPGPAPELGKVAIAKPGGFIPMAAIVEK
jgi:phage terminase large subunit GpA-like protein